MLSALAYDERPHPPIYDLRPLSRWLHGVRMSVLHSVVGDLQRKKRPRKHRKSWFQLHWVGLGWVLGRALVSMFRLSPVRFSMLRLSPVRFGSARFGSVRFRGFDLRVITSSAAVDYGIRHGMHASALLSCRRLALSGVD